MSKTNITLELDIEQTNLILEALGQLPFAKVYTLINQIQEAGRSQIAASQQAGQQAGQHGPNGAARSMDDE